MQVSFTVNGRAVTVDAPPNTFLVQAIREHGIADPERFALLMVGP